MNDVLESGWLVQGPKVAEFENQVAKIIRSDFAVATSSCTTALHLALLAVDVKPGDEVILPSFTYVATANAVEYVGAKPVFADIDPNTYNIDVSCLPSLVTERTKAIIPVHLFGLCADMKSILQFAQKNNLEVIEDAACAFGSVQDGQHAGTMGDLGCFSFHPRKIITTGEGGLVSTRTERLARRLRVLRNHGAETSDFDRHQNGKLVLPEFNHLGFNYRMSDLHAAVGLAQLKKLSHIVEERRQQARFYDERLRDAGGIVIPLAPANCFHTYQSYVIRITSQARTDRDGLIAKLRKQNISTTLGTHAVHTLNFYQEKYGLEADSCPLSAQCQKETLTLPLFPGLTRENQERVIDTLKSCLN